MKYSVQEVYSNLSAENLGGGKNAAIIVDRLLKYNNKKLIHKLLKKFAKVNTELAAVNVIKDTTIKSHLRMLLLWDAEDYIKDLLEHHCKDVFEYNSLRADLGDDFEKRFVATIKRQLKKMRLL